MNLIVDIGNTFIKLAVFNEDELLLKEVLGQSQLVDVVNSVTKKYPAIEEAIVSSVSKLDLEHKKLLDKRFNLYEVNHNIQGIRDDKYEHGIKKNVKTIEELKRAVDEFFHGGLRRD